MPTTLERMAAWAHALGIDDVPSAVREAAKNQVLSTLAAAHAGAASDLGPRIRRALGTPRGRSRAIPSGDAVPSAQAAVLSSAWSMVLDFDDSMLGGHTGHSSVGVPFAYTKGHTGADVLCAQVVANELAARVNTAVALGPLRGQMATHIHLIGASAARAKLEGLDPDPFAQAVGFALTYPAKALYPGFLGSDAKVLAAAWPVRQGLEAVDAVEAGLRGDPGILDGRHGFVESFADVPLRDFLGGLGDRWHTETNSFKIYPGCAYIDAVIDATLEIVSRYDVRPDEVDRVDVDASVFTLGMDARSAPFVKGPGSLISTLSFSTPYNVACAIRDRELTPAHLTKPVIDDPDVWALAGKVRLHHSEDLTIEALTSDAPVGAALKLAGRDALGYLSRMTGARRRKRLPKPKTLAQAARITKAVLDARTERVGDLGGAEKAVGAEVTIRTTDGRMFTERQRIAIGGAGWGDSKRVRTLMRDKFLACAAPNVGEERAAQAADLIERLEELDEEGLRGLVDANLKKGRRRGKRTTPSRTQTRKTPSSKTPASPPDHPERPPTPSGGRPPAADPPDTGA